MKKKEKEKILNEEESNIEESTQQKEEKNEEKIDPLIEANEKYLRLYAEFENFRRRSAKQEIEIIRNANENIFKELLSVIDDAERAKKSDQESENIEAVKEGFQLIFNKLKNILKKEGVKEMDCDNQDFDIDKHEAVAKMPAKSKKQKGKIIEAVEKGYYLNQKILRYAKVIVGE